MASKDSSEAKTPHEILERIITHKKHWLLEDTQTPQRIKSLLEQRRDLKCTAEVIAHLVFPPDAFTKSKDNHKSQSFLKGAILRHNVKDKDFSRLKSEIQRADHLTERTRISILNVLDAIH